MDSFQNILIIKLKHLGDVLTTTPLIEAAADLWPQARIGYLVNPGAEPLVRYDPRVAEVLAFPRGQGLWAQVKLIRHLRRSRYDLVLETSGGDRGAFYAFATGARVRVGYQPKSFKHQYRKIELTHVVTTDPATRHTVTWHLDLIRALGVDPGDRPMRLFWPDDAPAKVKEHLARGGIEPGRPYAVVHPSSRWMFKAWRPEANARVIDYLSSHGLAVVVTAAPEAKELEFVQKVFTHVQTPAVDLSGRLNLSELAALIAGGRIFFGVDSLPMHMAAAVGTRSVVLFGPSGEHMWGPWGPGHQVITKPWDCRPCGRDGCHSSKISRCLVETLPEEVFPALDRVLADQR